MSLSNNRMQLFMAGIFAVESNKANHLLDSNVLFF